MQQPRAQIFPKSGTTTCTAAGPDLSHSHPHSCSTEGNLRAGDQPSQHGLTDGKGNASWTGPRTRGEPRCPELSHFMFSPCPDGKSPAALCELPQTFSHEAHPVPALLLGLSHSGKMIPQKAPGCCCCPQNMSTLQGSGQGFKGARKTSLELGALSSIPSTGTTYPQ